MPKKSSREKAVALLTARDRTEEELRRRLRRDGFEPEDVEATLCWLKEIGYLDDRRTAKLYVENRNRFGPLGRLGLEAKLKEKGIDGAIIDQVINNPEQDYQLARRLAAERLTRLGTLPKQKQRQRLGSYLGRRGFSWEVIRSVLAEASLDCLDTDL